jgi:hypothetical protein
MVFTILSKLHYLYYKGYVNLQDYHLYSIVRKCYIIVCLCIHNVSGAALLTLYVYLQIKMYAALSIFAFKPTMSILIFQMCNM